jgi:signal transduction histidine kinase
VLRSAIASLGPPLLAAPERDALPLPPSAPAEPTRPAMARLARLTVFGLGIAGVLPPLAFTARPGELGVIGAVPVSVVLTGILILAPALVGLVAALFGLDGVRDSFRIRGDKEHEQAVLRVFVAALAVGYGFLLEASAGYAELAAPSEIVAALGLSGAWVFLALAILDPSPSPLRYYLGIIYDAALLSAFLHFGGILGAPWFPLYLLASFYAGFRFGPAALAVSAVGGFAGFVAVVLTTQFWHEQGLLAGGLCVALVALPAYVGAMVREVATSREAATSAQAARTRFLMVISQALRVPLDAIVVNERDPEARTIAPSARALLSQFNNILDFSAIEAGAFVPMVDEFDLHRLVNETLADRRAEARARGQRLSVHIDPALPYRLRGWSQQLAQIIDYLVVRALEGGGDGAVRIGIDAAGLVGNTVDLRLAVHDDGITQADVEAMSGPFAGEAAQRAQGPNGAFALAVVKRLVELMGGRIAVESAAKGGGSLTITVPLEIDEPPVEEALDLGHCLLLIATEDSQFASEIAEPLNAWHGDPRWIEGFGGTLNFVDRRDGGGSVLIVDGRTHVLSALTFAHRAASGASPPSFVLMVAEPAQIDGFIDLADGEIDAVLAAPVDAQLLANALHSLPLRRGASPRPVLVPAEDDVEVVAPLLDDAPSAVEAPGADSQVLPISAHPRFSAETPIVDPRAIVALRGLGDDDAFLSEIIDSFRVDAEEILQRIVRAAAMTDVSGFARGIHALRSCTANLGGMRLCEVLLSLREVGRNELREQGSALVQRLGDELARFDAALSEFLPSRGERVSR